MTKLLIRLFVKQRQDTHSRQGRRRYGLFGSLVGIVCNLLLFAAKFLIGMLSGSVSIMADAVNNLSDIGSSVVTLLGFKLSAKPADKEHPFGHGRMEYMSGFIVAIAIILVGFELLKSSVEKIVTPEELTVTPVLFIVLGLSVLVKLWMFFFNRKVGKLIDSTAMKATSFDSLSDAVSTTAVLAAMAVSYFTGYNLDAYMGAVVAVFILVSGVNIARDTLNPLLGQPPEREFVQELEGRILAYDGIVGIHDLVVHNYGPGRCFVTVHAEVPANVDILASHDIVDLCERQVGETMGIEMVIHMDPIVTDDEVVNETRQLVRRVVEEIDKGLSMHDFRMVTGETHTNLIFDVVVYPGFSMEDAKLKQLIERKMQQNNPKFFCVINLDKNYNAV